MVWKRCEIKENAKTGNFGPSCSKHKKQKVSTDIARPVATREHWIRLDCAKLHRVHNGKRGRRWKDGDEWDWDGRVSVTGQEWEKTIAFRRHFHESKHACGQVWVSTSWVMCLWREKHVWVGLRQLDASRQLMILYLRSTLSCLVAHCIKIMTGVEQ